MTLTNAHSQYVAVSGGESSPIDLLFFYIFSRDVQTVPYRFTVADCNHRIQKLRNKVTLVAGGVHIRPFISHQETEADQ